MSKERKWTDLMGKSLNGLLGSVKQELESNPNIINAQDSDGLTALGCAVINNHQSVIKHLLKKGADANLAKDDGFTPTMLSIINRHSEEEVIKVLKILFKDEKANINAQDQDGLTAVGCAVINSHNRILTYLLGQGADFTLRKVDNFTPLHLAAWNNNTEGVRILLNANADIECKDNDGVTPLGYATMANHLSVVKSLVGRGADISAEDIYGRTPLSIAKEKGYSDIFDGNEDNSSEPMIGESPDFA